MLLLIAGTCARLGVDGLRADIVCARAATALAALDGAGEVEEDHVRRAARLALAHRRRRGPFESPGLEDSELDEALEEARGDGPDDEGPAPGPGAPPPGGEPGRDPEPTHAPDPEPAGAGAQAGAATGPGDDGEDRSHRAAPGGLAPQAVEAPAAPGVPPLLALAGRGQGARGGRSRGTGPHGAPVDSRAPDGPVTDLALAATLRAAALRGGAGGVRASDLREHVRAGREGNLVVFCVDASGSMGARRRMGAVKGAILGLLLDAYQRRDRVALVTFRGEGSELALPPTGSVERAAAALAALPTGGGTPIAAGFEHAARLVAAERRRDPDRRALVLAVTDGRASGGRAGRDAAERAAAALGAAAEGVVVFDAEEGAVRLGLAGRLAGAAGARLLPLAALAALTPDAPRRAA